MVAQIRIPDLEPPRILGLGDVKLEIKHPRRQELPFPFPFTRPLLSLVQIGIRP